MNIRHVLSCLILAGAAPLLRAQDAAAPAPSPAAQTPVKAAKNEPKTKLETKMDKMGGAYRKLRKQVADPSQNESSLKLLATMQDAARSALDLTPAKAADIPEGQRAKFVSDYQAGIKDLQAEFGKLEAALRAGKNDDAVALVKEIGALERKEHKAFRRPEKD